MTAQRKMKSGGSPGPVRAGIPALLFPVFLILWTGIIPSTGARDLTAPAGVVNVYLDSLVNGDTQKLAELIDGRMKQNNRQLVLNPETYAQFLRRNYAGVQTTLESIGADGARVRARVRFDYPSGDSSVMEFLLTEIDGVWKITDEIY
ncbi:MAG: hypothetical protein ACE5FQ_00880 [Thiogranum sp.]